MLVAFNKPFGVISQFTPDGSSHQTLAAFDFPKGLYSIGRLDAESEGLLLLSDEPELNEKLLHPRYAHRRVYWAQVERIPNQEALEKLKSGLWIGHHRTLPCLARLLDPQPEILPRNPPIRFRKNVQDVWMELELTEGKNHQVRRMTAVVGHPTLRLIRIRIGHLEIPDLPSGAWKVLQPEERKQIFDSNDERPGGS